MTEGCTWGLRRHELFIKGGTSRLKLLNEGGMRGAMDARSVDELLVFVEQWSLGCRGRDFIGDDGPGIMGNVRHQNAVQDNSDKTEVSKTMDSRAEVAPQTVPVEVDPHTGGPEGSNTAVNDPLTNPLPSDVCSAAQISSRNF
ncbi:hypothetical protein P691DRAFT_805490 [Macrolepiota fuliginosa MF-IS2]|uniref:Uncharacterized protein n=1 Tax=Macrolepiota fuliginosa MF-IS2 TaxID=1400762 RepID=A0A9P5XA69_9AGAR|nr:hypothetical protein P691DRAFT_805490 [Macrolepiota fuliginosa MF-IS2]